MVSNMIEKVAGRDLEDRGNVLRLAVEEITVRFFLLITCCRLATSATLASQQMQLASVTRTTKSFLRLLSS